MNQECNSTRALLLIITESPHGNGTLFPPDVPFLPFLCREGGRSERAAQDA